MAEVADGDRSPRAGLFVGIFRHQPPGPDIAVPLQVPPHPVVVVAGAVGEKLRLGVQQQSRGFRGRGGNDDNIGRLLLRLVIGIEVPHGPRTAAIIDDDLRGNTARSHLAVAGRQGDGDDGVVASRLGVDRTGKPHAGSHVNACRPAVVGHRVAEHGDGKRMQPQPLRGLDHDLPFLVIGEGGHGIRLLPRAAKGLSVSSPLTPISYSAFS